MWSTLLRCCAEAPCFTPNRWLSVTITPLDARPTVTWFWSTPRPRAYTLFCSTTGRQRCGEHVEAKGEGGEIFEITPTRPDRRGVGMRGNGGSGVGERCPPLPPPPCPPPAGCLPVGLRQHSRDLPQQGAHQGGRARPSPGRKVCMCVLKSFPLSGFPPA